MRLAFRAVPVKCELAGPTKALDDAPNGLGVHHVLCPDPARSRLKGSGYDSVVVRLK